QRIISIIAAQFLADFSHDLVTDALFFGPRNRRIALWIEPLEDTVLADGAGFCREVGAAALALASIADPGKDIDVAAGHQVAVQHHPLTVVTLSRMNGLVMNDAAKSGGISRPANHDPGSIRQLAGASSRPIGRMFV